MSTSVQLAELDKKTAEDMAVKQFTDLYNEVKERDLDISKLELVLRNTFYAGTLWQKEVIKKETEVNKTYAEGLEDMFDAAESLYGRVDNYSEFYNELLVEKYNLKSNQ